MSGFGGNKASPLGVGGRPDFADARILEFRFDPIQFRFIKIDGAPAALHGYSIADWQSPGFFGRILVDADRVAFESEAAKCAENQGELLRCLRIRSAQGADICIYVIARFVRGDAGDAVLSGQIVSVDEFLGAPARSAVRTGAGREMLQLISDQLSQSVRALLGVSTQCARHVATQQDEVGSEFALEIRAQVSKLEAIARHLHQLTLSGRVSAAMMEEALDSLRSTLTSMSGPPTGV